MQPLQQDPVPLPAAVETADQVERILDASAPLGERADRLRMYLRKELDELEYEIGSVARDEAANLYAEVEGIDRRVTGLHDDVEALRNEVAELRRGLARLDRR